VTSTGTCFTIAANNITLNGQGYTVFYGNSSTDSVYGIFAGSRNNVTIRNINIREIDFGSGTTRYAIYFTNSNNILLENSYFESTRDTTNYISNSENISYDNVTINQLGTYRNLQMESNSNNITIINSNISRPNYAGNDLILFSSGDQSIIRNSYLESNSNYPAINYGDFNNTELDNNIIINTGTSSSVIIFGGTSNSHLIKNNVLNRTSSHSGNVIWISSTSENITIYNNSFYAVNSLFSFIKFINIQSSSNEVILNTTIDGKPYGNYYQGIEDKSVADTNGDGVGDSGFAYPISSDTWSDRFQGNATDFGPLTNRTDPYTYIDSCQTLNMQNTYYVLTQNVSSSDVCFSTRADNIVFDGQGHTIEFSTSSGFGRYGIRPAGSADGWTSRNVSIRNVNIVQGANTISGQGIEMQGGNNPPYYWSIENVSIYTLNLGGISLAGRNGDYIRNVNITSQTGTGIIFSGNSTYLENVYIDAPIIFNYGSPLLYFLYNITLINVSSSQGDILFLENETGAKNIEDYDGVAQLFLKNSQDLILENFNIPVRLINVSNISINNYDFDMVSEPFLLAYDVNNLSLLNGEIRNPSVLERLILIADSSDILINNNSLTKQPPKLIY
jgi:hypothetical protein